jgi:TPR repeat protein
MLRVPRPVAPIVLAVALFGCGESKPDGETPAAAATPEPTPTPAAAAAAEPPPEAAPPAPADCDACKDGECRPVDAEACHVLSENHRYARGVALDLTKHGEYAELACNAGYMSDCSVLAMLYQDGLGGREHSDAMAHDLHLRACDGGAGIGCFNLAGMIEAGGAGPSDPERAKPLYAKAIAALEASCDGGDVQWCANVGYMYGAGHGVGRDDAKAVAAYEKGCPAHEYNCVNLALLLMEGRGAGRDVARGRKLLEDGCEAGGSRSCSHLGTALLMGREDIEAEPERAVAVLTQACDGGQSLGCIGMAAAHGLGIGGANNRDLVVDFSERACALGDSSGCGGAIRELLSGVTKPEPARIRGLLEAACKIGSGTHCGFLAQMVRDGIGGDADPTRAADLFAEGCRRGDFDSCAAVVTAGGEPDVLASERPKVYEALCRNGLAVACEGGAAAAPL